MPAVLTVWTDSREALLTKRWAEGDSAAQIAVELQGTTRNAVLGKLHRMGLSTPFVKKVSAGKPIRVRKKCSSASHDQIIMKIARASGNKMRLQPATKTEPFQPRCVEVAPLHKSLLDLEPGECRYPYGDGPFTFCSRAVFQGAYCGAHYYLTVGGGTSSERAAHRISKSRLAVA